MKRLNIKELTHDEELTRVGIGNELNALYSTIEFILDEYKELGELRAELLENGKDLKDTQLAQLKLLEHLTGIYNTYR